MRNRFDKELELLNNELIEMGSLIESAISLASRSLMEKDPALARQAIEHEPQINDKEKEIERRCLRLLLQQQPVAADLRTISTALKMITDMERIGDQAEDIAEITLRLIDEGYAGTLRHIPMMADATAKMVTGAIDAFVARDVQRAHAVVACDDVVDDLFVQVRDDLIGIIRTEPDAGAQAIDTIMIAKYYERIGDHATNIAEWVIFSITGEHGSQRVI